MTFQNNGLISLHEPSGSAMLSAARTIVVSGVARSGTSMVARVLQAAGVFMGQQLDDVVFEDNELAPLFETPDQARMLDLVRQRNRDRAIWGFKRPNLHLQTSPIIDMLRNPFVVLTMRDPVAIAERSAIAEQQDVQPELATAAENLLGIVRFADRLTCPVLLISYEKAVRQPDRFVERLLDFCGINLPASAHLPLIELIEPGRPAYVENARRVFEGYIDEITGTILSGWAWQRGLELPLNLTLLRDGKPVLDFVAEGMRGDLAQAQVGEGRHGFRVDLSRLGFVPRSKVTVRVSGRNFELTNSGRQVGELLRAAVVGPRYAGHWGTTLTR